MTEDKTEDPTPPDEGEANTDPEVSAPGAKPDGPQQQGQGEDKAPDVGNVP